jgi:hypothetical protein
MGELPGRSNFFSTIHTTNSKEIIAALYRTEGWGVRNDGWADFELETDFAELSLEADNPILMHGLVADILQNIGRVLKPLIAAGESFSAECYDENRNLIFEIKSPEASDSRH